MVPFPNFQSPASDLSTESIGHHSAMSPVQQIPMKLNRSEDHIFFKTHLTPFIVSYQYSD